LETRRLRVGILPRRVERISVSWCKRSKTPPPKVARRRLGAALGAGQPVTKSTSQNALKRLQEADLIVKLEHGQYQLQDDTLGEWLRHRKLDA